MTASVKQIEKVRGNKTTNGYAPTVDSSPAQAPISVDRRKLADRLQSRQVTAVQQQQQQHSALALNLAVPHPVQPASKPSLRRRVSFGVHFHLQVFRSQQRLVLLTRTVFTQLLDSMHTLVSIFKLPKLMLLPNTRAPSTISILKLASGPSLQK